MRYSEFTSEELCDMLTDWSEGYDAEDVWTGNRLEFDKKIIRACEGLNHRVEGMLYRGQGVSDETAVGLTQGRPSVSETTQTLLTSWTKDRKIAEAFARTAYDNHGMSAVVIGIPARDLEVIVDLTQLGIGDEKEVICCHRPIALNAETVLDVKVWKDE